MRLRLRGRARPLADETFLRRLARQEVFQPPFSVQEWETWMRSHLSQQTKWAFEPGDFSILPKVSIGYATSDAFALGWASLSVGGILAEAIPRTLRESLLQAGVAVLVVPEIFEGTREGDDLIVDFQSGTIENITAHRVWVARPLTKEEIQWVREAPARQWYGWEKQPVDPDVWEAPAKPPRASSSRLSISTPSDPK